MSAMRTDFTLAVSGVREAIEERADLASQRGKGTGIESFAKGHHTIQGGFPDGMAAESLAHQALHAIAVGGARYKPLREGDAEPGSLTAGGDGMHYD